MNPAVEKWVETQRYWIHDDNVSNKSLTGLGHSCSRLHFSTDIATTPEISLS